jgi:hypothetical protein
MITRGRTFFAYLTDNPGQTAYLPGDRFSALGFRKMFAIGRKPGQADWTALDDPTGINRPDIFTVVCGVGMIGPVHCHGLGVVIDRDVYRAAESHLDSGAGSAAACEIVDDQFVK